MVCIFWLNLYADRNKFIPTGGVKKPNSKLAMKITAMWTGSIPKWSAIGVISGTTTIIAENISIKQKLLIDRV